MFHNKSVKEVFSELRTSEIGLTENQAEEQGYRVRSDVVLFRNIAKSHIIGEIAGQIKMVSDAEDGRILGVHLIGPHATDLVAEGALAIQTRCTVKELSETIHAHPTLAEIMLEASHKAMGQPLHG